MSRSAASAAVVACLLCAASNASAAPPEPPAYGADSAPAGSFRDVLPPGTNGRSSLTELLRFRADGTRPTHNDDQRGVYEALIGAVPGTTPEKLDTLFKDSTLGVKPENVERRYSPRDDVTVVRSKDFGHPQVTGSTREGAMFGLGYVAAEDRLFFIDVLRNLGRAQVSSFAGGAPGNRALDEEQWEIAPYTEADLQRQVDQFPRLFGAEGEVIKRDVEAYVAGVNRYITEAKTDPTKMPGEYAAIGRPQGADPWKVTDVIAIASLVGGIFGKGGGTEMDDAAVLQALRGRFGTRRGTLAWKDWAQVDDPDALTSVRSGRRFPYGVTKRREAIGSAALPDPGSVRRPKIVTEGQAAGPAGGLGGLLPRSALPRAQSNALLVGRSKSATGRPLAVFGPQTGYFSPNILMEQEVRAPGIAARGASFPGVNLYVQLGHGPDYAWSATSAGQDNVDVFAVPLCRDDDHYVFRGECVAMETLERRNAWTPTLADATPAGSATLTVQRTKLGIVTARGTVKGRKVAFTKLRSTYFHEVDSAVGFKRFNEPANMESPREFQRAAQQIGYTFNWYFLDRRSIAYFNSGNNPVRGKGVTGLLPTPSRLAWRGYDPDTGLARYTPPREHPQFVDGQPFAVDWNNKQARGYGVGYGPVHRVNMLDEEVRKRIAGRRRMSLPGLVDAMGQAATTDLRAESVLPLALRVLRGTKEPGTADAIARLEAWRRDGAHRRDKDGDGTYEHADAIRILDAWWPRWMRAQFEPKLGKPLFDRLVARYKLDDAPGGGSHIGSAYQDGWYSYAFKDLAAVLGRPRVRQPYAVRYCGNGRLGACRAALARSLAEAARAPNDAVYAGDDACAAIGQPHDQDCYDRISFRALGGITQPLIPWQNRPTYQQAVSIAG